MTKIIVHRINTISKLKKTPSCFGVEIDLRSKGRELILHHDPYKKGENFNEWLKFYAHEFIIINIKEEGLEEKAFALLKKYNIKNFFFLDQSFPFLIKYSRYLSKKTAVRYSEYESFETVRKLKKKVIWVWVDCFKRKPLKIKKIKKIKLKICLVSPELQGEKDLKKIKAFISQIKLKELCPDAVCTKLPNLWI